MCCAFILFDMTGWLTFNSESLKAKGKVFFDSLKAFKGVFPFVTVLKYGGTMWLLFIKKSQSGALLGTDSVAVHTIAYYLYYWSYRV